MLRPSPTGHRDTPPVWQTTGFWLAVVVLAGFVVVGMGLLSGAAAGQTTVDPIYNNSTVDNETVIENTTWMEGREDPTLHNISSYLADVAPFVIGTGSGGGSAGALVTGLLLFGTTISLTGRSRAGLVAGGVLGAVVAATLVEVSLAPMWMLAVVLMAVGFLLAAFYLRVVR